MPSERPSLQSPTSICNCSSSFNPRNILIPYEDLYEDGEGELKSNREKSCRKNIVKLLILLSLFLGKDIE